MQAGVSGLEEYGSHTAQQCQGRAFRSRQVLSCSCPANAGLLWMCRRESKYHYKIWQKEDFWFALACEQTGLLGHRCKNENTGLKVRIKWRTLMFYKFCEIGIEPRNLPDTAAGSGTGSGRSALGRVRTAVVLALGLQCITQLPGEGGRLNIQGCSASALSLPDQPVLVWLSTLSGGQPA